MRMAFGNIDKTVKTPTERHLSFMNRKSNSLRLILVQDTIIGVELLSRE
jgi:hypothetical protein